MVRPTKAGKTTKPPTTRRKSGQSVKTTNTTLKTAPATTARKTVTTAAPTAGRGSGRSAAAKAINKVAKTVAKRTPAANQTQTPKAARTAAGKRDLHAQIEKLEQTVATYRAKSRESNRAAKVAAARIAELESQVKELQRASTVQAESAGAERKADGHGNRRSREIDPGDAVPPAVAVQEPAPLDLEAETALDNLEEHLADK